MEWQLLEGASEEDVRQLLQIARRRRFTRNEVVVHRDDPGDPVHLTNKERFAVRVTTPLGDVATIAIRGPGDSFGEMALVSPGGRRSATVAAVEEGEAFSVYRDDFERLRKQHPQVDAILLRFLTREV